MEEHLEDILNQEEFKHLKKDKKIVAIFSNLPKILDLLIKESKLTKNSHKANRYKNNSISEAIVNHSRKRRSQREIMEIIIINTNKPSKAAIKIARYLDNLFIKDRTQKIIITLRKDLKIPKDGLELNAISLLNILNNPCFFIPDKIKKDNNSVPIIKKINIGLAEIKSKIPIANFIYKEIALRLLLFYDAYNPDFFSRLSELQNNNFFKIVNSREEMLEYAGVEDIYLEHIEKENEFLPIQIRISPFAGKNELREFIENNWKNIRAKCDECLNHDLEMKKFRTRDFKVWDRNMLIYENKHLPYKHIHSLVRQEYAEDPPDEGEIGKIISIESKRRK